MDAETPRGESGRVTKGPRIQRIGAAALDEESDRVPRVGDEPLETWLPQAWRAARQMAADVRRDLADHESAPSQNAPPALAAQPAPARRPKVGRNAPCSCGSGKKYKTYFG